MFSTVMAKTVALTALRFVLNLGSGLFKHQKADSLVAFTKATRVEPITMIDQRAIALPYLHDVLQAVNSMFIGYYLQAVALLVNVGSINVVKLLDSLNPQRDVRDAANAYLVDKVNANKPSLLSLESYATCLPIPSETASLEDQARFNEINKHRLDKGFNKIDEAVHDASKAAGKTMNVDSKAEMRELINGADSGQMQNLSDKAADLGKSAQINFDAVKEATNLSVGKMVEVTIQQDQHKATFPISVRLIATIISSTVLSHILGDGSRDITWKERYHGWRSGQLEFWRDIVMAQDLIDERRKALMKDDSGTYAEILKRRAGNAAAGVMSATPSIGTASNIVILTQQTAKELELSIGGRLSDAHTRKKVFDNTYIMIMVVLDTEWEQVTIYHRGLALPTKLSIKELKTANKGSGPDVAEILKAYQLGNSPSL